MNLLHRRNCQVSPIISLCCPLVAGVACCLLAAPARGQTPGAAEAPALSSPAAGSGPADPRADLSVNPPTSPPASPVDPRLQAALDILREKGLLTDKEYENALRRRQAEVAAAAKPAPRGEPPPKVPPTAEPPAKTPPTAGPPPKAPSRAESPRAVTGKFEMSLYGFVELDGIYDTTQSFNELAGNNLIARPGTFAAEHGRALATVRNSRLGFKVQTPQWHRASLHGTLEFDLLGNQPPGASEIQTFVNDTFRVRHAFVELKTPWLNVLIGQSWQLFGWQSYFHPATVAIQGVPGQLYSRAPQLRLSHMFEAGGVQIEAAIAAARSPQRDSAVPDGQAGVRLRSSRWQGVHSTGSTGTAIDGAAIGFSGALRRFSLAVPTAVPPGNADTKSVLGWGFSVDAVLPIVPARERRAFAVTANGSFVRGTGIADFYTGLTGGVGFPSQLTKGYAPNFTDIDNGIALYTPDLQLETVGWQSFLVGLQIYLPPRGLLWLAGNFSQMDGTNITDFAAASASGVILRSRWADVNVFADVMPGLRLGAEYSWFWQQYDDTTQAWNHRVQLSAFYIF